MLLLNVYLSLSLSSFDQLRTAASTLKRQATQKNEGSLAYVKGGLSTFFEAQDALSGMQIQTHSHTQTHTHTHQLGPLTTSVKRLTTEAIPQ